MPTYEYACQSCGTHVEVYQRFSDEPLSSCSVCGGPLRKVFHAAGILFKGPGFYATDSRSRSKSGSDGESGKTTAAKSEATGASSGGSSGRASKESGSSGRASKESGSSGTKEKSA